MWRHFRGDFLIYAGTKALAGLSSFLVLRLLTSAMAPAAYGAYALLFALVAVCSTVPISFLTNAIVRFIPEAVEKRRAASMSAVVYQMALPTILAALVIGVIVVGLFAVFQTVEMSAARAVATLADVVLGAAYQIRSIHAYALRRRRLYSGLMATQLALFIAAAALLDVLPVEPVAGALGGLAISYAVPLVLFPHPIRGFRPGLLKKAWGLIAQMLRYGAPIIALNVAVQLNTYLDQFVIRLLRGEHDVGLYASNYVVADKVVYALASVIALTLEPLMYREWARGAVQETYRMVWRCVLLFIAMCVPIFIVFSLNSDLIMGLLTSPSYASGRIILPYVMSAAVLSGLASVFSHLLSVHKRSGEIAAIYVSALLINLVADLIAIPPLGILGAAISTLLTAAFTLTAVVVRANAHTKILSELVPLIRTTVRRPRTEKAVD